MVLKYIRGTEAIANAVKMADVDVFSGYPIRPSTGVINILAKYVADGELDAEYVIAESEHTQFEVVKHASLVGARTFTASAGIGLAFAYEPVVVMPALRVPVVAMIGNRALDEPGSFGSEHNEMLGNRDMGWIIRQVENPQEAQDLTLQAYRISEDNRVLLPHIIGVDGNFITHVYRPVDMASPNLVKKYLPPYHRPNLLDPDHPVSIATQVGSEGEHAEIRKEVDEAMKNAKEVIKDASNEFEKIFGRKYDPFFEEYMAEDADYVIFAAGSVNLTLRKAVRILREKGMKVGAIKLRTFRPFPAMELAEALRKFKGVGIIDINFSAGSPHSGGVYFTELRSALYDLSERPIIVDFISGLVGRDIKLENIYEMAKILENVVKEKKYRDLVHWIGFKGIKKVF